MDKEGALLEAFKFYQSLNGCVVCFHRIPRSASKRSSTSGTRQRHTPGFAARMHSHCQKIDGVGTVEKDTEHLCSRGCWTRYLARGNSMHDSTPQPTDKVEHSPRSRRPWTSRTMETLKSPRESNANTATWTMCQAQHLMRVVRNSRICRKNKEERAQTSLQRGDQDANLNLQ